MNTKRRLIMDGIMLVLLMVLMHYSLTGGLMHELLGTILLAGFIVHMAINRKYYGAMIKAIRDGRAGTKGKISFAINIILPITVVIMLVSSAAVSEYLFPGIAGLFSSSIWIPVHAICGAVLLICVFAHVCMHAKMFEGIIDLTTEDAAAVRVKTAGMRVMALLFALLVVKNSFSSMAGAASLLPSGDNIGTEIDQSSTDQNNELIVEGDDPDDQDGYVIEVEPDPEPEETVSLDDYIGSLFCSGCGKHCSLLSPRCGKGENQASQAEAEYYELYSGQSV
jgi:hypothetical protein